MAQLSMFADIDASLRYSVLHHDLKGSLGEHAPGGNDRESEISQKLRGGYYTPGEVAAFLADWAIRCQDMLILEPSAGDGEIIAAAAHRLARGHILGVELNPQEARKALFRGGKQTTIIAGEFFSWFRDSQMDRAMDAVIGNPPFIRYQDFPEDHRQPAFDMMQAEGLKPSRRTNAWMPFVVAATKALRPGGRLAMVLPAELLQVTYAGQLREYLTRKYAELTVITFRQLIFPKIQQETVLLLGIRQDNVAARVSFVELDAVSDLDAARILRPQPVEVDLDHAREKWTQYYLSPAELGLIRDIERSNAIGSLGDYAQVDVGVVTGRNDFFVLTRQDAARHNLLQWCLPIVGRSAQIPGLVLNDYEWDQLVTAGEKCYLLQLGSINRKDLSKDACIYTERSRKLHRGLRIEREAVESRHERDSGDHDRTDQRPALAAGPGGRDGHPPGD